MAVNTQSNPIGRWLRAIVGIALLGFISVAVSEAAHRSFLAVFSVVCGGALFTAVVLLAGMTRWARRRDARSGQFSIATLLLIILLASLYFAAIRWVVVHTAPSNRTPQEAFAVFGIVAVYCMLHMLISIPFVLGVLDGMLWLSVWIARRPMIQRLIKRPKLDVQPDNRSNRSCSDQR